MTTIYINGERVERADVQGDLTTNIEVDTADGLKKSVTGTITLYGRAWQIVKEQLIDPADGLLKEVSFRLEEDCTSPPHVAFEGVIQGQTVSWCEGECSLTCNAVEKTDVSKVIDCLKSTLIYAGMETQAHPRMVYCDEIRPDWLHAVVLILGQFSMLTLDLLTPVIYVVAALVTVVNALASLVGGNGIDLDGNPNTNTFQEWQAIRQRIQQTLIGCGRVHPSPLVRDYITNACTTCGANFQSSIFTDPASDYYTTVLWNAPVKKGTLATNGHLIYENRPIMSAAMLLDRLKEVFNARYDVRTIGGTPTLLFERKDKLGGSGVWVDPMQLEAEGRLIGRLCYEWDDEALPAYANIGFAQDGMDEPGNEARDFYADQVEWNQPFNPSQKGEFQRIFQFGMNRNRRDGMEQDTLDQFVIYPSLVSVKNQFGSAMLVSRGVASLPKLLVWENGTNPGVVRKGYTAYGRPADQNYNVPLHCNEYGCAPLTAYEPDAPGLNLYGRFHAIDHPKVMNSRRIRFRFEFEFTGAHLSSMNPYAEVPLPIAGGISGNITSITINHAAGTILVAGKA